MPNGDNWGGPPPKPPAWPVVTLLVFLISIFVWTVYVGKELTNQHLILAFLIALVGLSLTFDRLAIGSLFSVERRVKNLMSKQQELDQKQGEMREENAKFKDEAFRLILSSMNQMQTSRQNSSNSTSISFGGASVIPASPAEREAKEEEQTTASQGPQPPATPPVHDRSQRPQPLQLDRVYRQPVTQSDLASMISEGNLETFPAKTASITYAAMRRGIPYESLVFDVKVTPPKEPAVGTRPLIFDGYARVGSMDYFFEVFPCDHRSLGLRGDRIYRMLSELTVFKDRSGGAVKLIMLLVPNSRVTSIGHVQDQDPGAVIKRVSEEFRPALNSGLFEVEYVEATPNALGTLFGQAAAAAQTE